MSGAYLNLNQTKSKRDEVLDRLLSVGRHDVARDEVVPVLEWPLRCAGRDNGLGARRADLRQLVEFLGARRVEVDLGGDSRRSRRGSLLLGRRRRRLWRGSLS